MAAKIVLVFGASGTVGQGFIKASLDNDTVKVVGIFRSEESAKRVTERLGNPSNDKFVAIVGTVGSDEEAKCLQKCVQEKVGNFTDIVAAIGAMPTTQTTLQALPTDEFVKALTTNRLVPYFLIAKYFLPLIQDKPQASCTYINGNSSYVPNMGQIGVSGAALKKLCQCLWIELKEKPVRLNEFAISCLVLPWDNTMLPPGMAMMPHLDNMAVGRAIMGVVLYPACSGETITVVPDTVGKIAQQGTA